MLRLVAFSARAPRPKGAARVHATPAAAHTAKTAQKKRRGPGSDTAFRPGDYPAVPRAAAAPMPDGPDFVTRLERDSVLRHDRDGRSRLFGTDPAAAVPVGSVILVEQLLSKTRGNKQNIVGILTRVNRRGGIGLTFSLRTFVQRIGVEMTLPVYSPMVTRVQVLRAADRGAFSEADFDNIREADPKTVSRLVQRLETMVDTLGAPYRKPPPSGPPSGTVVSGAPAV